MMRARRLALLAALAAPAAACEQPPGAVATAEDAHRFAWDDGPSAVDAAADAAGVPVDAGAPPEAGHADAGNPAPLPFSIVALPDTQYYASNFPDIFDAQAAWLVREHDSGNIAFVLGEGDIVDNDVPDQWQRGAHSLHMLDGVVPYVIAAGNHDYCCAGWPSDRTTMIDSYFPVTGFAPYPWFKGTFEPNRIANNYTLFEVPGGGGRWLVLSLEFGPRDEVLAWADGIAKQYAATPTIVVTHAYLYDDNTRYDYATRPEQEWNPHSYPIGAMPGAVNDGEEMWQKLVLGNPNIRFVLCGHVLDRGVGRLTSTRPDGTTVHQILANYQDFDMGGDGYLRIMQFFPATRLIHVRTYSPYFDTSMTDPDNDFALSY